ncbi:MAG TPA: hypothetical protein DDZ51_28315 [Planctomycetaceae bacterium]|nr:hypothetical protein [Planctomycetaceae bacterium]
MLGNLVRLLNGEAVAALLIDPFESYEAMGLARLNLPGCDTVRNYKKAVWQPAFITVLHTGSEAKVDLYI